MSNEQRRANGHKAKDTFITDVEAELDRLEKEIKAQATSEFPRRVKVTQELVAKAGGHHRTTFKNHGELVLRLNSLKNQARDPKSARVAGSDAVESGGGRPAKVIQVSPRNKLMEEENLKLKIRIRAVERELFLLKHPSLVARGVPNQ